MTFIGMRMMAAMLALVAAISTARAEQPYSPEAFKQAQAAGKSILVDVFAPWCPTCKAQKPVLSRLEKENPALTVFKVDFDTDKTALQGFKVQQQSTLIMFKGAKEVGRSVGDTNPDSIAALVAKGS